MDYSGLQAAVSTALGRDDTPDFVYEVALAEINRDVRIMEMETATTLTANAESTAKPSGWLEAIDLYIETGGYRNFIQPQTTAALDFRRRDSGRPLFYAETNSALLWLPTPDGSYTVNARYYAENSALVSGSDTNAVLTKYPEYYLYTVLSHASLANQDDEARARYATAAEGALARLKQAEIRRKISGPMRPRMARDMSRRR